MKLVNDLLDEESLRANIDRANLVVGVVEHAVGEVFERQQVRTEASRKIGRDQTAANVVDRAATRGDPNRALQPVDARAFGLRRPVDRQQAFGLAAAGRSDDDGHSGRHELAQSSVAQTIETLIVPESRRAREVAGHPVPDAVARSL